MRLDGCAESAMSQEQTDLSVSEQIIRKFGDCGVVRDGVPPVTVVDRCSKAGAS